MSWKVFHINTLQESTHVSRLPFFTHSCTRNFFVSSWKEVDYICFYVSINCQSRVRRALWAGKYFNQSPVRDDQVILRANDWEGLLDQLVSTV
jgi:hypothetical protein